MLRCASATLTAARRHPQLHGGRMCVRPHPGQRGWSFCFLMATVGDVSLDRRPFGELLAAPRYNASHRIDWGSMMIASHEKNHNVARSGIDLSTWPRRRARGGHSGLVAPCRVGCRAPHRLGIRLAGKLSQGMGTCRRASRALGRRDKSFLMRLSKSCVENGLVM